MKVVERKPRGEGGEEPVETEGARRATGVFPGGASPAGVAAGETRPEVEVVAKAERRRFTAEYKRRIVREGGPVYAAGGDRRAATARGAVRLAPDDVASGPRPGRARGAIGEEARPEDRGA